MGWGSAPRDTNPYKNIDTESGNTYLLVVLPRVGVLKLPVLKVEKGGVAADVVLGANSRVLFSVHVHRGCRETGRVRAFLKIPGLLQGSGSGILPVSYDLTHMKIPVLAKKDHRQKNYSVFA